MNIQQAARLATGRTFRAYELIQLNFQAMYKSPLEQQTHSKFQEAFPSGEANVYSAS